MNIENTTKVKISAEDLKLYLLEKGVIDDGQRVTKIRIEIPNSTIEVTFTKTTRDFGQKVAGEEKPLSPAEISGRTKISDLNFSKRTFHCLKGCDIVTLQDLLNFTEKELRRVRNIGNNTIFEINELLKKHGMELSKSES